MRLPLFVLLISVTSSGFACELELAGTYALRAKDGSLIEALKLEPHAGHLGAFMRGPSGWEPDPQQLQPFPAAEFATFTKLPAPEGYCGVALSGTLLARVPKGWQWGGLTIESGFTLITIGGPREAYRVRP